MDAQLTVNHARLTGAGGKQSDLERWLALVPVDSLGLNPDETLYVPRLSVRAAIRPGAAGRAGAGAVADRLRSLLAGAERDPASGLRREGVYRFSSRARYLAWLASLWLRDGSTAARSAFTAATGCASLRIWQQATLLRDGARLVPFGAALAEIGLATRWAGTLDAADLALTRAALADSFGLPREAAAGPAAGPGRPPSPGRVPRPAPAAGAHRPRSAIAPAPAPPAARLPSPARRHMVQAAATLAAQDDEWERLAPERRQLLICLVVLARIPSLARARDFAAELADVAAERSPPSGATQAREARLPAARPPPAGLRSRAESAGPAVAAPTAGRAPAQPGDGDGDGAGRADADPFPRDGAPSFELIPAAAVEPAQSFATGYAGLLFLLNAFVALDLYPDFTEPRRRGLAPSPLRLADRVARWWFGHRYRRDPLCGWIAGHACDGRLPTDWAVESGWLDGFDTESATLLVERDRRATLWHRAGFPLADGPVATRRRLRDAARACGCRRRPVESARAGRLPRLPRTPAERWTACLALYLDARIRLAAGDPKLGLASLALAGELRVSGLDLTATFRLDAHPIGLRIAGLDRDPGWQPAEGRSIGFRFE